MTWTDEAVALLQRLWMEGKSASQISRSLGGGISRNAVIGKIHRLGLAGRIRPQIRRVERIRRAMPAVRGNLAIDTEAEIDVQDSAFPNVTIMELRERSCRWPLGQTEGGLRYCGAHSNSGPYCQYHHNIAYHPVSSRRS